MEFTGPPTPSRESVPILVNLSERLGCADVDSLPALAGEVAQGQKHQLAELRTRLMYLQQTKAEYMKTQDKISTLKERVRCIERKIFSTEDQIHSKNKDVLKMERDLNAYFDGIEAMNLKHIEGLSKLNRNKRSFEQYRMKMASFKSKVDRFYEDSEISKSIRTAQHEIETAKCKVEEFGSKEKRQKVLSGEEQDELEQNLQGLREQEKALRIQLKSLDDMLREEGDKRRKIKQGADTLQKRNAAQVTRIKRQLQDGCRRTRNVEEEISNLEAKINQGRICQSQYKLF